MSLGPIGRQIEQALREALSPRHLEVIDESARHAGHAGANPAGESHFHVVIEAEAFRDLPLVARHRLVNEALGELLEGRVHALRITARSPEE